MFSLCLVPNGYKKGMNAYCNHPLKQVLKGYEKY